MWFYKAQILILIGACVLYALLLFVLIKFDTNNDSRSTLEEQARRKAYKLRFPPSLPELILMISEGIFLCVLLVTYVLKTRFGKDERCRHWGRVLWLIFFISQVSITGTSVIISFLESTGLWFKAYMISYHLLLCKILFKFLENYYADDYETRKRLSPLVSL